MYVVVKVHYVHVFTPQLKCCLCLCFQAIQGKIAHWTSVRALGEEYVGEMTQATGVTVTTATLEMSVSIDCALPPRVTTAVTVPMVIWSISAVLVRSGPQVPNARAWLISSYRASLSPT